MPPVVVRRVLCDDLWDLRSWPYERHLAPNHVQKLRQLVDAGTAEDRADAGDARIARPTGVELVTAKVTDAPAQLGSVGRHRAELKAAKAFAPPPNPVLRKQCRARRVEANQKRDEG